MEKIAQTKKDVEVQLKKDLKAMDYLIALGLLIGLIMVGAGIETRSFSERTYSSQGCVYDNYYLYVVGNLVGMIGTMMLAASLLVGGFINRNIEVPVRIGMIIGGVVAMIFMTVWGF